MANAIPTFRRDQVKQRARFLCERCRVRGAQWHHRRPRNVPDEHQHCCCNGVWLCGTCHRWAHANPRAARDAGFIVSRFENHPGSILIDTWHGCVYLTCSGTYRNGEPG